MRVLKFNPTATANDIGDALLSETIGSNENTAAEITPEQAEKIFQEYDCSEGDEFDEDE